MARVQSVDDTAAIVFVGRANAHHSEWLESVSPSDCIDMIAHDFCNLSGCEQFVSCPSHIDGSRLDFVMNDASDIVDVFVVTPLNTKHHCFVS